VGWVCFEPSVVDLVGWQNVADFAAVVVVDTVGAGAVAEADVGAAEKWGRCMAELECFHWMWVS
jgi:hypothetical protein